MFIPTTRKEMDDRGWDSADVIIVSGDTYLDSPYNGAAVIGHWLMEHGFRVGMIAQPDTSAGDDIGRLGEPNLFWSITSGCVDSMVANYSPTKKRRNDDDFTPGGMNNRRPDRACIAYTNLVKRYFKGKPIVLGGIEASLRRIVHYDMWSDGLRRSILFDSKADIITYGMSELSNLELAHRMRDGRDWKDVPGICYISSERPPWYLALPSYEKCCEDQDMFADAFRTFYENCDPITAKGVFQGHGNRFLVQNPPSRLLTVDELDEVYSMGYEYRVHPYYAKDGPVKAMETVKNSVTTHRGCYGGCSFCAIAVHQGRTVVSRSEDSILGEVSRMASDPSFNGIVYDVGGPTANMYGIECGKKLTDGACKDRMCLYPKPCKQLPLDHSRQISLLDRMLDIPGVKRVFVTSGIRYDMVVFDEKAGKKYVDCIVKDHVSGQLKVAPEHVSERVLELMKKPNSDVLLDFKDMFDESNLRHGKRQFLTYYLMAAHPGCYMSDMEELDEFVHRELKTNPEQVQIFTPTPSTVSTLMYYTRRDYEDTRDLKSEHSMQMKQKQKDVILNSSRRRNEDPGRSS